MVVNEVVLHILEGEGGLAHPAVTQHHNPVPAQRIGGYVVVVVVVLVVLVVLLLVVVGVLVVVVVVVLVLVLVLVLVVVVGLVVM